MPSPYPLAEIQQPEQFLVVEHFIEFKNPQTKYERPFAGQVFTELILPKPAERVARDFAAHTLGLIVEDRAAAGLPERDYMGNFRICSIKAIKVGSFLNFMVMYDADELPILPRIGPQKTAFLQALSHRLIHQLTPTQ